MALEVEDGTGKPDAESYVSAADCSAYADKHGLVFDDEFADDADSALRRATAWLDGAYRARWPGKRTHGRAQGLEWPRDGAADVSGDRIANDEIPAEIVRACCEAAVRELANPGALSPDVVPGQIIAQAAVAGAVSVTYASGDGVADQRPVATVIDDILSGIINQRSSTSVTFAGRA